MPFQFFSMVIGNKNMFDKILIATRGEIACRVIRTAKRMGITCATVFSSADEQSLHVRLADEAYYVGPAPALESYLQINKIINIAKQCGAQAIHPGYGFLAENAEFAEACLAANIHFVGPPPDAIRAMGSKSAAKDIVQQAGIPVITGYHSDNQSLEHLQEKANKIGYPILLKAIAGGGGRGMRIVNNENEFAAAFSSAKREALSSFANDTLLIEKYLTHARHIEIQIFADMHGNCVSLFDRDCSIQRRHQKIIEEAPAPHISQKTHQAMSKAAISAAQKINYVGAGTIEFLLDDKNNFYFMEMNTRLQVEHPVTEKITGLDLVEWQLRIAAGEKLPLKQNEIKCTGHAIEVRICAEDPHHQFLPTAGQLHYFHMPTENNHVRVDTGVQQQDHISSYYDSLITKLIVWDENRHQAVNRLQQALTECHIVGVPTNIEFLQTIIANPHFINEQIETSFIELYQNELFNLSDVIAENTLLIASLYQLLKQQQTSFIEKQNNDKHSPWQILDNWRLNLPAQQHFNFYVKQQKYTTIINQFADHYVIQLENNKYQIKGKFIDQYHVEAQINNQHIHATIINEQNKLHVFYNGLHQQLSLNHCYAAEQLDKHSATHFNAPMPGTVVAILTKPGTTVEQGAGILVIEAMKMEHTIYAPSRGVVKTVNFQVGDRVDEGVNLIEFTAESDT